MNNQTKELFWKSMSIALAGYPISYVLNLLILPPMLLIINLHENVILNTVYIGFPYFIASTLRIFTFEYVYNRYNINIDPAFYIKRLLKI